MKDNTIQWMTRRGVDKIIDEQKGIESFCLHMLISLKAAHDILSHIHLLHTLTGTINFELK